MPIQPQLPDDIENASPEEILQRITAAKKQLSSDVVILGHHYQRDDVIVHADFTGDSLKLAKIAQEVTAKYIIFCGVHFMAETADMLISDEQKVSLPDLRAGCDMADMADADDVARGFEDLDRIGIKNILPITYINSSAALKAIVGERGGVICTSSNAKKIIAWAVSQNKHVFFFPDQHLGRNIAKSFGMDPVKDMCLWEPEESLGGHSEDILKQKKIWLWKGHCPVHALFSVHQIKKIRAESPDTHIIVHPECAMEVVDLADSFGSTDFIIQTVTKAAPGTKWAVGTEKNLVERLAAQNPDKSIVSLNSFTCVCGTMNRISAKNLLWILEGLSKQNIFHNTIKVEPKIKIQALSALKRMLEMSL